MSCVRRVLYGACGGALLMLLGYGAVLFAFWLQTRGTGDAITQTILDRHAKTVSGVILQFLWIHLAVGCCLGAGAAMVTEVVLGPGSRRATVLRGVTRGAVSSLAGVLYLNLRLAIEKPMFYDALFGGLGGVAGLGGRAQRVLTESLSPEAVDWVFAGTLLIVFAVRRRDLRRLTRLAVGTVAVGGMLIIQVHHAGMSGPSELLPAAYRQPLAVQSGAAGKGASEPLNVLYLAADSLRPDHLSCNGYERVTSPHIDALARHSVCFDEAYVPLARTLPSWASLLTSTDPHTHGFRHMFPSVQRRDVRPPTLPRLLSGAGYTSAIVADYAGECFDAVNMGFDRVDVPPATSLEIIVEREFIGRLAYLMPFLDNELGYRILPVLGFLMINADPRRLAGRVIRTLQGLAAGSRPFFLTAFFSCTHIPYAVPYPYYNAFTDPRYRGIHRYGFGILDPRAIDQAMQIPDPASQRQITALYDGAVLAFDAAVGRILEALDEMDLARRTIVVISSDHGENLYDNGNRLEHGERFGGGDAANRCTFIYYDPDAALQPRHVHDLVSTLDVMPTLLARLRAPIPETARGRDLGPLLRGETLPARPVFCETGLMLGGTPEALAGSDLEYPSILQSLVVDPIDGTLVLNPLLERRAVAAKERQIRTGRYKMIYRPTADGARFELYDLHADPENRTDLYGRPGLEDVSLDLQRRLVRWMLEEPGSRLDGSLHLVRQHTFFE